LLDSINTLSLVVGVEEVDVAFEVEVEGVIVVVSEDEGEEGAAEVGTIPIIRR
jgi:hypothetical protein